MSPISLGNDGCRVLGTNCSKYGCTIFNIAGLFLAVFSLAKKFSRSSSGVSVCLSDGN